ncbi:MAG: thioredoxin-disulfide reductase [Candidatus Omnitrophica bacterium]|nr:thioredoxin-disulfide reductase [Candidatus Omnitrophota bacterium]
MAGKKEYYVIIIGAGPAGLTAAIYCGRSGLRTLIVEKTVEGGQILKADIVENYPGFPEGISGFDLMGKMKAQAEKFGAEFVNEEVIKLIAHSSKLIAVNSIGGSKYFSKAVIIATGANPKELGIKGEAELTGRGVSYCATCDGPLFKNKEVIVIGGGDAAVGEAVYLARFAKKVSIVHRRDRLRAAEVLQDRFLKNEKGQVIWDSTAIEVLGTDRVSGLKIKNLKTGREEMIPGQGVFIYVGLKPNSDFLKEGPKLDEKGFIITNEDMQTSIPGIFACGDIRKNALKQVVVACSEGAQAAFSCLRYLENAH